MGKHIEFVFFQDIEILAVEDETGVRKPASDFVKTGSLHNSVSLGRCY
jgi:hypothetical protein